MKSGKLIPAICIQFTIVIFFSGFGIINLKAQKWDNLANLQAPVLPNIPMMAAVNGKVYVVSGQNGASVPTYEYDPATDTWAAKAPIPQGCFWASAVALEGKIYVMGGGQPYPGKSYNYIYDQENDTWTKGADLLTPRMYHSACTADGKIYIMGGQNGDGTSEWYFDEYDPKTDSWQRKAQLPHNSAWYCGAVGIGKNVYRIAGGGANPTLTKDYFDVYNTETNTWTTLPNFRLKLHAPAVVNYEDKILVVEPPMVQTLIQHLCMILQLKNGLF